MSSLELCEDKLQVRDLARFVHWGLGFRVCGWGGLGLGSLGFGFGVFTGLLKVRSVLIRTRFWAP